MALREDVRDLHKWGNPPSEIAKILGVHVEQVQNILIALGLVKKPTKAVKVQPVVMPRERIEQLRKLDAEIKFYETRVASLRQHRVALSNLEQSGANLAQSINRATR